MQHTHTRRNSFLNTKAASETRRELLHSKFPDNSAVNDKNGFGYYVGSHDNGSNGIYFKLINIGNYFTVFLTI